MQKLFEDKETFQKDRPLCLPNSHFKNLCDRLAKEIVEEGFHDNIKQVSNDLEEYVSFNENGYEIAKTLDNKCSGYRHGAMFVEHLDFMSGEKDDELKNLVKQWVKAHNPQPKFNKGDKLQLNSKLNYSNKQGTFLYITGKDEKTATYYLHENKDHNGGYVYAYEKIEAITTLITD